MEKCDLFGDIVRFIKQQYLGKDAIALHEPILGELEKHYLCEAIDSGYVSSIGPFVEQFEQNFSKIVGSKHAISTVNGTSALHLALKCIDTQPDDFVITQALTFVATANAVTYCHAEPIFIDVDKDTLGLCPVALLNFLESNCSIETGVCLHKASQRVVRACIPMHSFGHPVKIDAIKTICDNWNISLIEDAAESLGSFYKNKATGTYGKMGIFSFNGNKIVTSGGGGCVVTDDPALAKRLKHLSTTAKTNNIRGLHHDEIGYNYRLPNINAALLMAQLEQLDSFIDFKRKLAFNYQNFFKGTSIRFHSEPENSRSNYWLNTISFENTNSRDSFLDYTAKYNIITRASWVPLIELSMYKNSIHDGCVNTLELASKLVNLPSGVHRS